ncbi:hydroquinone glucosyltransferase-like [Neltuma alba]|uniref:hydroquinone glucosyltransferase-like n=1 Tax=Neltuma alba TaxID=207710 RepID=UPI0010A3DC2F|nr:hydroquinone glucosyltransferase-like [Prosopis alba]
MENKAHIAVVSIPAFSHQASILSLCKRLLQLHPNLHITFILPVLNSLSNASKSLIDSLPSFNIHTVLLPPVTFPQGSNIHPALQVPLAMSQSVSSIRHALNSLNSTSNNKLVALIADYLAYETLGLAKSLNILSYIYFPSSATVLSLCLHSSWLHQTVSCEYTQLLEPIKIPGCIPIHGRDLPTSLQDRSSQVYEHFLRRSNGLYLASGILVNSFKELEEGAITALQEQSKSYASESTSSIPNKFPSVYPIGPIVQAGWVSSNHVNHDDSECLRWLDKQEPKSVLYVSFGSGGTLSQNQMNELALGLELSGQKFLWVVREPNDLPSANYFTGSSKHDNTLRFLPNGFMERMKGKGLAVPCWAPQVEILRHKATGGFLTHCGWNSTLEAVVHGLPIIAWPLFAEQRTIAVMLSDGLNVAVRPKVNENGIVEREEIAMVIKRVMIGDEGTRIRATMEVLQHASSDALKQDGSSSMILSQLAMEWKNIGA